MVADERLAEIMPNWLVIGIFYALPYILCGYDVLRIGAQSILKKDFFNEFTLMGGATIAAIALGQLPEAVGVMLFYCVGEFVRARRRALAPFGQGPAGRTAQHCPRNAG